MRIGFISTRLSGTDGVSLEVEKWSHVLRRMGHDIAFCAGELGEFAQPGVRIEKMHFTAPDIQALSRRSFGAERESDGVRLSADIHEAAGELRAPLRRFILQNNLDLIIIENALAIPMNLPLGVCLAKLIEELELAAIAHHHDFFWERQRFQSSSILDLLDTYFPPKLASIRHVVINSIAQTRLKARRGIDAAVIPNVHDFAAPPDGIDAYNRDFRQAIGLEPGELFILQPTRVIQRKGIEKAIELVSRLDLKDRRLFITHSAGDEGLGYWRWIQREARMMGVDLRLIDSRIAPVRSERQGSKIYSLWDAYPHADLVTYPSEYEGFGNALLEAVYFGRLVVVNRYPVYNADIRPLGFEFIELDGFVSAQNIDQVHSLLMEPDRVAQMAARNYERARRHFSLQVLEIKLNALLANLG